MKVEQLKEILKNVPNDANVLIRIDIKDTNCWTQKELTNVFLSLVDTLYPKGGTEPFLMLM